MIARQTKRRPKKRRRFVWIVIHCEFLPTNVAPCNNPSMDEMVFHVASSLAAAETYIRRCCVQAHSWWKVERRAVDEQDIEADDRPQTMFYNHARQPRKSPPHAAARRAFDKWQTEEAKRAG